MQLIEGEKYQFRLTNGCWRIGTFLHEKGPTFRANRHFIFTNDSTGRTIEVKSMQRARTLEGLTAVQEMKRKQQLGDGTPEYPSTVHKGFN